MFATRVNGYVKIRGVRVSLPEIEDAAPPSGDPDGGGGLPQRREQRGGARCPVSDPRRYPLPLSEIRAFATGYLPCTHIPTRFIHAEALPLSANGKTDRHRIRADLSHQQTAPALNACAARRRTRLWRAAQRS